MMRVLVVSDIHGNWEALRTVAANERYDRVICLGDIVDYGPQPVETVRWVREHASNVIRGNHDTAVGYGVDCRSAPLFRRLSEETRKATIPMLSPDDLAFLRGLSIQARIELDGVRLALLHASPRDPLYHYLPPDNVEGWEREITSVDADVVLVGHTHLPFVLHFGTKMVVNPGSVGLQRDGEPRASYAGQPHD